MVNVSTEWMKLILDFHIEPTKVESNEPEEYLVSRLCWHCCHEIPGKVLQYPIAYDDRRGSFKVCGQFCSWECMKGYSRDKFASHMSGIHQLNLRHYRKKITGLNDTVIAAPPFMSLKAFGGTMTIEEFRTPKKNVEYDICYAKLTKLIPYQMFEYKFQNTRKQVVENKNINIETTGGTNDCLKLRRPKPLAKEKGTLERTLGLNGFGNLIKTAK